MMSPGTNLTEPVPATDEVVQILLVDDQPVNLEALELMLAPTGCRFVRARSAEEALLALLDQDFAAIVLDIRMPGMTGLELAHLIKRRRRTQHVPILFLTAHMLEETDVLRGYQSGAVDYLTKPVRPDILRSKIAVFVELYRKSRALQREIAEREAMEEALRQSNRDLEKRVEERTAALREADRRKDEFLAALAHELRNPLAALRAAAEVIRIKSPENSAVATSQGVIDRQLRQMTRLIDDLLDVSRITRDKLILRRSVVDLADVVRDAVDTVRPLIEARRHELEVALPAEPLPLEADRVRLSQVFSNLLDNAAKYTEPGGRIRLIAAVSNGRVSASVEDTGIGIDPAVTARIFDLFMQADHSPDRAQGGLGIGLTLVRRLVELHGGWVEAHSDGPGQGSRFTVTLPIYSGPTTDAGEEVPRRREANRRPNLRVLIAEDNQDAAEMLQIMLANWGQDTQVASDGAAALELAATFRPQVVLLDVGLPRLNGYEVARKLREQPWGKDMCLIAITGWGQEGDRQQSEAAGINHHLLKPVEPDVLEDLLAKVPR